MGKTKIEWTDHSWNPIRARNKKTGKVGWHCEHATTGCEFCYSEGFNLRLGTGLPFKPGHRKDVDLFLDEEMLSLPLRWRKPRMIFVCSMTDLFADFVPDEWIDRMFAIMARCQQHTFQILTKRSSRMRAYLTAPHRQDAITVARVGNSVSLMPWGSLCWPLPNVWLGVSAERQEEADERIPDLIETPANVHFLSLEPLLGPIDFRKVPGFNRANLSLYRWWVIAGGESGHGARPMHADWARSIRDQCQAAGVPFFFKQWGAWVTMRAAYPGLRFDGEEYFARVDGRERRGDAIRFLPDGKYHPNADWAVRLGKTQAGRLLDGREHNEMPSPATREAVPA